MSKTGTYAWQNRIRHIQALEPVTAGVAGRPNRELESNLQWLRDLVDSALLGQGLKALDQTMSPDLLVGQPCFWNKTTQRFEQALAGVAPAEDGGVLAAISSAVVMGVVISKTNPTLGDIATIGYFDDCIDLTNSIGPSPEVGTYYLSTAEPGKLTIQRPPISVQVLHVFDNNKVIILPANRDFLEDHIHYQYNLTARPAGTVIAPNSDEVHTIQTANVLARGWLPAGHAIFEGKAPTGAKFGYNLSQHPELDQVWPPIPLEAVRLEMYKDDVWDPVVKHLQRQYTINFGEIPAHDYIETTVSFPEAAVGDVVTVDPEAGPESLALPAPGVVQGWVVSAGMVTIRYTNPDDGPVNPDSDQYHVRLLRSENRSLLAFTGLQGVQDELVQFDENGIWWMSNCYNEVPWPTDFDNHSSSMQPSGSLGSSGSCPIEKQIALKLSFARMTFATAKSTVTSLRSLSEPVLQVLNCDLDPGTTGDLRLLLNLQLMLQDSGLEGFQVIKNFDADTLQLQRGPVVEGLFAGTNVSLSSSAQLDVNGTPLHQGRITIAADVDPTGKELALRMVRVDDVRIRFDGNVFYLAFLEDQESDLRMQIDVPPAGLPTDPHVKFRAIWLGTADGTPPAITLTKVNIPRPAGHPALPSGDTAVTFDVAAIGAITGGDYFEIESDAIAVAAGDTLFATLLRAGSDGYAGELGLIRVGAVLQSGS